MSDLFGAETEAPLRLFFALWPPRDVAQALHDTTRGLQGRVMNRAGLHVTVGFAGAQLRSRIPALCELAQRHPLPRVPLCFDQLQYWSQQFVVAVPSVLPTTLKDGVMRLHAEMRGLGMKVEPQGWSPHITLLRHAPVQTLPPITPQSWTPESLHLAVSDGTGHYDILHSWPTQPRA